MAINENALQAYLDSFASKLDGVAAIARNAIQSAQKSAQDLKLQQAQMQQWTDLIAGMKVSSSVGAGAGSPDLLQIENIPGRRVPFDVVTTIQIPANLQTAVPGTYPISMDGPFVAVSRFAIFVSGLTFQVTSQSAVARYVGRSFGRQRPISSVNDLTDAMTGFDVNAWASSLWGCGGGQLTTPPVASPIVPNNHSPFRTMEWDGYISVRDQVYPRQSVGVPSGMWAPGWNQQMQLAALDYWEKGSVIEFSIEPGHVNNPPAGNIQAIFGSMPYLASQYDAHEGIMYPAWQCTAGVSDVIQRRPDGILFIGFHGFKILSPAGVAVR